MIEYYFQPMYVKEYIAEPILFMPSNEAGQGVTQWLLTTELVQRARDAEDTITWSGASLAFSFVFIPKFFCVYVQNIP